MILAGPLIAATVSGSVCAGNIKAGRRCLSEIRQSDDPSDRSKDSGRRVNGTCSHAVVSGQKGGTDEQ